MMFIAMGKKSNAKKQRRLKATESPANLDEPKKESKVGKVAKKLKIKVNKKKLFGGALAIIMAAVLISAGYLIFVKGFRPEPIAKFLPQQSTIAVLEINTNLDHKQVTKAFKLLEKYPQYSLQKLEQKVGDNFLVDFKNQVTPWMGRSAGLAVINPADLEPKTDVVYFAEVYSQINAEKFANEKGKLEQYAGTKIYTSQNSYNMAFIGDYLFACKNLDTLKKIIDSQKSSESKLYASKDYSKIDNNLPLNKLAFAYVNFDKLTDGFFQYLPFLTEKGITLETVEPFTKYFAAEGFSVATLDTKFEIESFLSLREGNSLDAEYLSKENYSASLAKYISPDALLFWGGENLPYQLTRIIALMAEGKKETMDAFTGLIQNYTQKYFGPTVSFVNDLTPLLSNEFAFGIESIGGKNVYKALIKLTNSSSDAVKLQELADNFATIGAFFEPKVVEHKLPDGTVAKEIVAVPEEVIRSESAFGDIKIYEMDLGKKDWGIFFSVVDNVVIIATNIEGVKNSIDATSNNKGNLQVAIEPVITDSDEAYYFNIKKLVPALSPVSSITFGRTYFKDGISTIHYLDVE